VEGLFSCRAGLRKANKWAESDQTSSQYVSQRQFDFPNSQKYASQQATRLYLKLNTLATIYSNFLG
jgi:hypothetical protein